MAFSPSSTFSPVVAVLVISLLISPSHSQSASCSSQAFTNNKLYTHCNDLPSLQSYLHWVYDQAKSTLSVAFIAPASSDGWVSWAINPNELGMLGAQSLIAFRDSNGRFTVNTYNISGYSSILPGKVWFDVKESSAEYSGGQMRLFATLVLPEKGKTTVNQVWQVGPVVTGGFPARHDLRPANLNAKGALDLLSGQSSSGGGGGPLDSRMKKRNIHGILNVVSWGIMLPVGIIISILRKFEFLDPAWFYLHVFCQFSAYVIGVAGWGTGLKLGSESKGVEYSVHRNIGISLFCLATVQIFALLLRPKKDHKYRFYWNVYHHTLGYAIVALSIYNIFKGLDILHPAKKWKSAYIILIIVLGVVAVLLQLITRVMYFRQKSGKSTKPYDGGVNDG